MGSMSQKPHQVEDLRCGLFFGTPTANPCPPDLLRRLARSVAHSRLTSLARRGNRKLIWRHCQILHDSGWFHPDCRRYFGAGILLVTDGRCVECASSCPVHSQYWCCRVPPMQASAWRRRGIRSRAEDDQVHQKRCLATARARLSVPLGCGRLSALRGRVGVPP